MSDCDCVEPRRSVGQMVFSCLRALLRWLSNFCLGIIGVVFFIFVSNPKPYGAYFNTSLSEVSRGEFVCVALAGYLFFRIGKTSKAAGVNRFLQYSYAVKNMGLAACVWLCFVKGYELFAKAEISLVDASQSWLWGTMMMTILSVLYVSTPILRDEKKVEEDT